MTDLLPLTSERGLLVAILMAASATVNVDHGCEARERERERTRRLTNDRPMVPTDKKRGPQKEKAVMHTARNLSDTIMAMRKSMPPVFQKYRHGTANEGQRETGRAKTRSS